MASACLGSVVACGRGGGGSLRGGGVIPPINKYLLDGDLRMVRNTRVSVGVDQTISPKLRVNSAYAHTTGSRQLRGLNLNSIANGVRPDPAFGNVIDVVDDASSRTNALTTTLQVNVVPPSPNPPKPRWNPNPLNLRMPYFLAQPDN